MMKYADKGIITSAMAPYAVVLLLPVVSLAAPNTGSCPQKTDKQCKDERASRRNL